MGLRILQIDTSSSVRCVPEECLIHNFDTILKLFCHFVIIITIIIIVLFFIRPTKILGYHIVT